MGTFAFYFSQIRTVSEPKRREERKNKPMEGKRSKSRGVDGSDRQTWQQKDPLLLEKIPYHTLYTFPYPQQT